MQCTDQDIVESGCMHNINCLDTENKGEMCICSVCNTLFVNQLTVVIACSITVYFTLI